MAELIFFDKNSTLNEFILIHKERWHNFGWKRGDVRGKDPKHGRIFFDSEKTWRRLCGKTGGKYKGIPVDLIAPIYDQSDDTLDEKLKIQADYWSDKNFPILIYGEKGVGKNQIVGLLTACKFKTIFKINAADPKNILLINLSGEYPHLLEPNFKGTYEGSATGTADRKGYLERADKGCIFIDQVESVEHRHQVLLMNWINEGGDPFEFEREGTGVETKKGVRDKPIRVRIWWIAATNKNPDDLKREGKLREDFLDRFAYRFTLPSFKERCENAKNNGVADYLERVVYFMMEFKNPLIGTELMPENLLKNKAETRGIKNPKNSWAIELIKKNGLDGNFRVLSKLIQKYKTFFENTEEEILSKKMFRKDVEEFLSEFIDPQKADKIAPDKKNIPKEIKYLGKKERYRDFVCRVYDEEGGDEEEIADRLMVDKRTVIKQLKSGKWSKWIKESKAEQSNSKGLSQ
jgi:transcriptional regulator with PAS, ATPase and Fis domain